MMTTSTLRFIGQAFGILSVVLSWGRMPAGATSYQWNLPKGFPSPKVPDDNLMSVEKVALGRFLFYDTRMSGNQTQACASCHEQAMAFTDGLPRAIGSTGEMHPRSSMSLTNAPYAATLGWANPLLPVLEKQALVPMFGEHPVELGLSGMESVLLDRMRADGRYQRLFAEAFPQDADPFTLGNLVRGLTSFGRTLVSGNAPYDRYIQGLDDNALSDSAFNGGRLFFSERLECFHCHGGFNFSVSVTFEGKVLDEVSFQNNGLYNIDGHGAYPPNNRGLFDITQTPEDMGSFKAPTLRNITLTAPYMHDGSIATLDGVIDHYAAGGRTIESGPYAGDGSTNPFKSGFVRGFTLTDQEREDVLNFLRSLTDEELITNPHLSDPFSNQFCHGDCSYDGEVTVDELITAVNIALGTAPLAGCVVGDVNGDGEVTIDELLGAVNNTLAGCPPVPSPTVLVTPTPVFTPDAVAG
jgi:cytochrome c peroxidase